MRKFFMILAVMFISTGCAAITELERDLYTIVPDYAYEALETDPVILFKSDFIKTTFYSINLDPKANDNGCRQYRLAGYVAHESTKWNPQQDTFEARVPADKIIAISVVYDSGHASCTNYVYFTPEKNGRYILNMKTDARGRYCSVSFAGVPKPKFDIEFMMDKETCTVFK
jgi:hypothetical protein